MSVRILQDGLAGFLDATGRKLNNFNQTFSLVFNRISLRHAVSFQSLLLLFLFLSLLKCTIAIF